MPDLPKSVTLVEEGPREGFQMEPHPVPAAAKVQLIDGLSETGLKYIEVTSFVNPRFIPQMADAEKVAAGFNKKRGVEYSALTLTPGGVRRAHRTGKFSDAGPLLIIASDAVSLSNTNKTTEQAIAGSGAWLEAAKQAGFPVGLIVANAFGCNVQGDISPARVVAIMERVSEAAAGLGISIARFGLADTVGAANPLSVARLVSLVRDRFPGVEVYLHLHDTRGTGMANVLAGLETGVARFDCSIGGLGGCPYAGGAAGNVPTEDVALLCEEMGIDTGLDLDKLFECALMAERIVGHSLPGKAKVGGRVKHRPDIHM